MAVCSGGCDAHYVLAILSWWTKLWQPDGSRAIEAGDIVGIGIHTANALRGYEIGKIARERGAYVVFGGIHATLYPERSAVNWVERTQW